MSQNELYHHGILGQKWGVRRYQNSDGSLTSEGQKRYESSLSKVYSDDDGSGGDYTLSKGSTLNRRSKSDKDGDGTDGKKYTYTYDYDSDDDNFYGQFGRKITEYTLADDLKLAGTKTLGKAFVDKMLTLTDENDIDTMDVLYDDYQKRHRGEEYVSDLFTLPYQPSKHVEELEKIGAEMVASMVAKQRHESIDERLKRRGMRDTDTAANDIGINIINKLMDDGYSGMRDYNDYGSGANVNTPTVIFDPEKKLHKTNSWIED